MKLVTPYRIFVSAVLALAVAILYVGFNSAKDPEPASHDRAVVQLQPVAGSTVLRQERIYAELQPTYTGVLLIDGVEIPEDQLDHREGLNTVGFTPGPGTETGQLEPGPRCATVVYWPVASTREAGVQSENWCWNAH